MKIDYMPVGDYCIPNLELPQESRPIGKWGRMHCHYLETYHPIRFNQLILSGTLWTYLADLNEQAQARMETLIAQMKTAEGVTESLKANDPMAWVQRMNSIQARAEEIIVEKLILY
ncbi:MAG: TnpV protein [Clostridiales bacterium]|nr:TnpV protein [Clostridiales bacterium]